MKTVRPKLERRRQTLIHPGLDCRKVVRRRAPNGTGLTLWAHGGGGFAAQAAGAGIERGTSARIEGRLQRSVRSIFSSQSR
jgi:hypothetical protein